MAKHPVQCSERKVFKRSRLYSNEVCNEDVQRDLFLYTLVEMLFGAGLIGFVPSFARVHPEF